MNWFKKREYLRKARSVELEGMAHYNAYQYLKQKNQHKTRAALALLEYAEFCRVKKKYFMDKVKN
jgi:hypothetical protein